MQAFDFPIVGKLSRERLRPGEAYSFWEYHCKGFSTPCRDLVLDDVTKKVGERLPRMFAQLLTRRRNRLLTKITGRPRIGFLRESFSDAKFIHIRRDGRAVINSMINVDWWWGWRGPQEMG